MFDICNATPCHQVDERLLFDQLPHYLRGEVATYLTDKMLRESRAFGNLDTASRRLVSDLSLSIG